MAANGKNWGVGNCLWFRWLQPCGRVCGRVDFFEFLDRDPGVYLGGVQAGVSQDLLDIPDIGPILKHQSRHGVPEHVTGPLFIDAGGFYIIAYQVAKA